MIRSVLHRAGVVIVAAMISGVASTLGAQPLDYTTDFYVVGVYEGHTHKYGKVTVFVAAR